MKVAGLATLLLAVGLRLSASPPAPEEDEDFEDNEGYTIDELDDFVQDVAALIEQSIEDGTAADYRDEDGRSLVLLAVVSGDQQSLLDLMAVEEIDVNAAAGNDEVRTFGTPLIAASFLNRPAMVETLLAAGADPNLKGDDDEERTPLIAAAEFGYTDIAAQLMEAGADPHITGDNENALTMAIENDHRDIALLLVRVVTFSFLCPLLEK
eukprot:SAG31_NODE_447_length_15579_cov_5.713871_14_plen_210_part_00